MPIGGIPSEEQIERAQTGGKQWDDGKYTATGFRFYDDEKHTDGSKPIYVPDKNGELRAWVRIIIKGEDDGPPMSLYPGQVLPLAKAFGVEVDKRKWPDHMKDSSRFLLEAERAVEKAGKEVEVTISGGWVNDVPGWGLPRDTAFQFVYEDCYSRNKVGEPAWFKGDYGRTTILGFRVIGDLDGDPTPYDGWVERIFVSYRVEPDPEDPSAPHFVPDEGDKVDEMTRFYNLITVVCPSLLENDSWEDLENIMPEFDRFAKEARVILHTTTAWSKKAGKVKVYYNTLQPRYKDHRSYEEKEPTPQERNVEDEELEKAESITHLYSAITQEVQKDKGEKAKVFGPDGKLNKDGKEVAKKYFIPLIKSGTVPGNNFAEWEDEHVVSALNAMGYKDLAKLVQQNYAEKDDNDSDF